MFFLEIFLAVLAALTIFHNPRFFAGLLFILCVIALLLPKDSDHATATDTASIQPIGPEAGPTCLEKWIKDASVACPAH